MVHTNSEKLKVDQKIWGGGGLKNEQIVFTHLLPQAAMSGSLPGSYCNDPSIIISLKLLFDIRYLNIHV